MEKIKQINSIIGILSILAGFMIVGFVVFVVAKIPAFINFAIGGFVTAVVVVLFDFFIIGYLIKVKKLVIGVKMIFLSMILPLIVDIIFMIIAEISFSNFQFAINDVYFVAFATILITSLLFWLTGTFIILGIKNIQSLKPGESFHKIKTPLLGAFSLLFILAVPIGGNALNPVMNIGFVEDNYSWNTGPWLTYGDNVSSTMTISWLTAQKVPTTLKFGSDPGNLMTYILNSSDVRLHHVRLTGLAPNTNYFYQINAEFENEVANTLHSFKTAPTTTSDFKFIVVGDMQPTNERTQIGGKMVADGINAASPAFVLSLGDRSSTGGNVEYWHNVMQNIAVYGCTSPIMGVIGNHDYGGDASYNFRNMFPYDYETTYSNHYSFDYGNAHFINLDCVIVGAAQEQQREWVEQDIINAKANGQKWIFISLHYTVMSTGTSNSNFEFQQWLVPLADKYDVDGVFFGHDHHYEHWNMTYGSSGLLYDPSDVPSGNETHFWMSGGGGANLEVDYGVMQPTNKIETLHFTETLSFWNTTTKANQNIVVNRSYWNPSRYVDNSTNRIYAQNATKDYLYYHVPELESYSTANELLGYEYGEQTMHYMEIAISNNGNTCTVSTHYPNGNLLMGPGNAYPQQWTFNK